MFWRLAIPNQSGAWYGTSLLSFIWIKYFVLATAYFPHERVSSAQQGLTSLFGMGRGVTLATNHQHKTFNSIHKLYWGAEKARLLGKTRLGRGRTGFSPAFTGHPVSYDRWLALCIDLGGARLRYVARGDNAFVFRRNYPIKNFLNKVYEFFWSPSPV